MKKMLLPIILIGSVFVTPIIATAAEENKYDYLEDMSIEEIKELDAYIHTLLKEVPIVDKIDYEDAESFEKALNDGEDLEGKVVRFKVDNLQPDSAFGYDLWAGEHLNFVSEENPNAKANDEMLVRATKITNTLGSWIIEYEVVKVDEKETETK